MNCRYDELEQKFARVCKERDELNRKVEALLESLDIETGSRKLWRARYIDLCKQMEKGEIVRHGEWLPVDDLLDAFDCSICPAMVKKPLRYCPRCGAKMDRGEFVHPDWKKPVE